jgi:hypothetical protein
MLPDQSAPPLVEVPLHCPVPACDAALVSIAVRSTSVVTLRCTSCGFVWSAEIAALPEPARTAVHLAIRS